MRAMGLLQGPLLDRLQALIDAVQDEIDALALEARFYRDEVAP
jgi:hypothetical protein